MNVRHDDAETEAAEKPDYGGKWNSIVSRYRRVMNLIRNVPNESQLHNWKSLHFEKLKGNRSHQHSMRINDQWRLIVEFESRPGPNNNVCVIKGIEKHYE